MPGTAVPVTLSLSLLVFQNPSPLFFGPSSVHRRSPSGEAYQTAQEGKIWGLR